VPGKAAVEALVERFAVLASSTRKAIETSGSLGDADTSDLFTGVSRGLTRTCGSWKRTCSKAAARFALALRRWGGGWPVRKSCSSSRKIGENHGQRQSASSLHGLRAAVDHVHHLRSVAYLLAKEKGRNAVTWTVLALIRS